MAPRELGAATLSRLAGVATRHARWVLGGWVLLALALTALVPSLEKVVATDATPFLPASSPSLQAFAQMDRAFGQGAGRAIAFVVLSEPGLRDDDAVQAYYAELSHRLHADRSHIADLQDYAAQPRLRSSLMSKDGDATYIPVSLRHPVGSPKANEDVTWLRGVVRAGQPPGLDAQVTGDVASITDMTDDIAHSIARGTIVSFVIIIVILLLLYRSWLLPLVPLVTIGIALMTARALVSLLGMSFLPVSTYTGMFVTALVLGAGTDYTVFLISRFHEAWRSTDDAGSAVVESVRRIGPVVLASGLTVIIGSACMAMAKLALFGTTGPAIAVSILVTLVVGLTFTPALLAVLGDRARPRRTGIDRSETRWARVGTLVARRPLPLALAALVLLGALAAFWPGLHPSYDTRSLVPTSAESARGYRALDAHFPANEISPDYVVVNDGHSMTDSADLAVVEQ